jgi:hypothetical protein
VSHIYRLTLALALELELALSNTHTHTPRAHDTHTSINRVLTD